MVKSGDRIGDYVLLEALGSGGFGSVWLAEDSAGERRVAIKVLHREMLDVRGLPGPSIVDRFLAEARIIARLDHPGIVRIHELIDDRGHGIVAYSMEHLEGCDLTKIGRQLDLPTLLDVFAEVAETLGFLHGQGVIHRDITLQNIFICDPQSDRPRPCRVKLLDFGIAKEMYATQSFETGTGVLLGTIKFMSPEAFLPKNTPTAAMDQWGLGVAIYTCLTGRAPFEHVSFAELFRMIEQDPPPPMMLRAELGGGAAPPYLEAIVLRLLAKQPEDRYVSVKHAAEELRGVIEQLASPGSFQPTESDTEMNLTPLELRLAPALKLALVMRERRTVPGEARISQPVTDPSGGSFDLPPTVIRETIAEASISEITVPPELATLPPVPVDLEHETLPPAGPVPPTPTPTQASTPTEVPSPVPVMPVFQRPVSSRSAVLTVSQPRALATSQPLVRAVPEVEIEQPARRIWVMSAWVVIVTVGAAAIGWLLAGAFVSH